MSYLSYLCLFTYIKHVLAIFLTWPLSYKEQLLITLHEHPELPPVFGGSLVLVFLVFSVALCFVCRCCIEYALP